MQKSVTVSYEMKSPQGCLQPSYTEKLEVWFSIEPVGPKKLAMVSSHKMLILYYVYSVGSEDSSLWKEVEYENSCLP